MGHSPWVAGKVGQLRGLALLEERVPEHRAKAGHREGPLSYGGPMSPPQHPCGSLPFADADLKPREAKRLGLALN